MSEQLAETIIVSNKDVSEYALRVIVALRNITENEVVVIKGRGDFIEKAIDVYNEVKARIGDSIKLVSVNIGTEKAGRRYFPTIEIKLTYSA
ncbi:DNA-binding protein [Fervidicoccus sp.]|uniref:DNA-binding protein n=1 Tax=Fervidicoccus sp. TaxID=2060324 RepID=UPI003D0F08F5